MRRLATLLCLTLAPCWAVGCELGGTSTPALEWPGPDDRWRVSFVDPPWQVVSAEDTLILEIEAEAFGVGFHGAPPTHVFWIGEVDTRQPLFELVGARGGASAMPPGVGDGDDPDAASLDLPEYLVDIELDRPGVVALAELDHVLDLEGARLHRELETFETDHGQLGFTWQAVVEPSLFLRGVYLPSSGSVVRAGVVSRFDLETTDIDWMLGSIRTDAAGTGR